DTRAGVISGLFYKLLPALRVTKMIPVKFVSTLFISLCSLLMWVGKSICNYNHGKKEGVFYIYDYGYLSYVGKYDDDKNVSFSFFYRGVLKYDFYDFEYGNMQIGQLHFIGRCKSRSYHPNGVIAQQIIIYFDEGGPEMDTAYYPEIRYYDENGYLYKVKYQSVDDYVLSKASEVWYYDKAGNITKKESKK
ncbi:MAG: hypothetical protein IKJ59_03515, partial [Clostridia bacterium]|nr:hypothetical protein [Clostridia bacterium]